MMPSHAGCSMNESYDCIDNMSGGSVDSDGIELAATASPRSASVGTSSVTCNRRKAGTTFIVTETMTPVAPRPQSEALNRSGRSVRLHLRTSVPEDRGHTTSRATT